MNHKTVLRVALIFLFSLLWYSAGLNIFSSVGASIAMVTAIEGLTR